MARINEWVGKSPTWKLIHKSTVHGFGAADFHRNCDNKGETLGIIQSTNGYLFGWWTPRAWTSSGSYASETRTIIFTLTNPAGIPMKYANSDSQYSVFDHAGYGPSLVAVRYDVADNCNNNTNSYINFPSSYSDTTGRGQATFTGARTSQCGIWKSSQL